MLNLHSHALQRRTGAGRYCCTATTGRSSTCRRVQVQAMTGQQESKHTPTGTAFGSIAAGTEAEPLQHSTDAAKWKYVRQTGRRSWSYVVTIPHNLRPGTDTRPKVCVTKGAFRTPEDAAQAADRLHLAMFDPAAHPKIARVLNFPVSSYTEADVIESQHLLHRRFGEQLKLRDPNSRCMLQPLRHLDRTNLLSTIKRLAHGISSSHLRDSSVKIVGASLIGSGNRLPNSNAHYRTKLQVGGVAWSLQMPMTYVEAVVAHDLARVAAFGDGHSAIAVNAYAAADIELMRTDIQQAAPGLLEVAASKLAAPRSAARRGRARKSLRAQRRPKRQSVIVRT